MSKFLKRDSNTITIANFWENYLLDKYDFDPVYQRMSIWSEEKQSFLIDSILKNFPMPPIFMHQKIDNETGKTTYDIIDGKQRLTSIIKFIKNEIPVSTEDDKSPFYDEDIAGIYFSDLGGKDIKLNDYKKIFWRYIIPVEYIDTEDKDIIDNIFDRLNRNGEPLNGQELRKSKYHDTRLLNLVEKLSEDTFWKDRLKTIDVKRMENYEFISEIIFQVIEKRPLHADQSEIDRLYESYSNNSAINWEDIERTFKDVTNYMASLSIDYDRFSVGGVSHLYGIWCFAFKCVDESFPLAEAQQKLNDFYTELRSRDIQDHNVDEYKKSMSSRTKDQRQRQKRLDALWNYVNS